MGSYDLTGEVASLAIRNNFTETLNKVCLALGQKLQPFSFFNTDVQNAHGVLDLSALDGMDNPEMTIFNEIFSVRSEYLKSRGVYLSTPMDTIKRAVFFDYMLASSICYVEVPKYATKNGIPQQTFDKFLATRNVKLMAHWLGITPNEAKSKYADRIEPRQTDLWNCELRMVKLNIKAECTNIVVPRSTFSTTDMTCVPLFALSSFMDGIRGHLEQGLLSFTYLKDNHTERQLDTTLNRDIMMGYYKDSEYVDKVWSKIAIYESVVGGMTLSSTQKRGYVKLPEIGSSRYDETGTRSLNIARILEIESVTEVDRTFIDVDLASVCVNFENSVDYMYTNMQDQVVSMGLALIGATVGEVTTASQMVAECRGWVGTQALILSTTFYRQLHLFMVSNPQWFPLYTGKPAISSLGNQYTNSSNFGVEELDF